jgi:hypothetical protein
MDELGLCSAFFRVRSNHTLLDLTLNLQADTFDFLPSALVRYNAW